MTATQKTTKFQKISDKIKAAKTIAVFSHINHDPDGLGSMFGLGHFLERQGKKVDYFLDSKITSSDARFFETDKIKNELISENYDLLIMVDNSTAARLGKYCSAFKNHPNTMRLDHHPGLFNDAKLELTLPYTSACEVILEFIEFMGKKPDKTEAKSLYGGLLTDSAAFTIDPVNADTFKNAIKLIECGADTVEANNVLLKSQSLSMFKLQGRMIEKLEICDDVIISSLNARDFKQAGMDNYTTEGLSNKLLSIDGVNISCLIKQQEPHTFSCSFRSRQGYDVSKIAAHFGGGGHVQAAACRNLKGSEKQVKRLVLKAIRELK